MTLDPNLERFHIQLVVNLHPNIKKIVESYKKQPNADDRYKLNRLMLLDTDGKIKDVYLKILNNVK